VPEAARAGTGASTRVRGALEDMTAMFRGCAGSDFITASPMRRADAMHPMSSSDTHVITMTMCMRLRRNALIHQGLDKFIEDIQAESWKHRRPRDDSTHNEGDSRLE
jgi:hypothetical protein